VPIFDIQTLLQFYEMLIDDFDDLMRERHSARRAFHCIMEVYHLREWVWHDLVENNQKLKDALKVTSESDFRPHQPELHLVSVSPGYHER